MAWWSWGKKKKKKKKKEEPVSFSDMQKRGMKGYADSLKRASYGSFEEYEREMAKKKKK